MYLKNTASKLEVFAFDYTTGAPKTGDAANITAYVNIDDAGYNALGDTSAAEVDSTNKKGLYLFDLAQGETNGTRLAFFAKSSTANVSVICRPAVDFTQPATGLLSPTTAGRTLDVSAGGEAGVDWANVGGQSTSVNLSSTTTNLVNTLTTYTGNTVQTGDSYAIVNSGTHGNAAIKGYVDDIGTAGAGLTAIPWNAAWDAEVQSECADALVAYDGLVPADLPANFAALSITAGGLVDITQAAADKAWGTATRVLTGGTNIQLPSNGLANVSAWSVAITGNITGNLSGSVGSVTGAVGSVTGAVGSVTGNVGGNVTGSVGSLATQAKADVNAEVLDVLNVDTLIDGKTFVQAVQYVGAVVAGRASGAGTGTEVFKGLDESTTRVTVTVDSSGNRSDIVYG